MAIKNIEMSVYNGSSYDTLLPVTSSENVTIASAISGLFGLGADSTLTDILQKLSNAVIWDGSSTELPNGSSIVTGARIETGSYVGTGTYGASNPCSLTFSFIPNLVIVKASNNEVLQGVEDFIVCIGMNRFNSWGLSDPIKMITNNTTYIRAFYSMVWRENNIVEIYPSSAIDINAMNLQNIYYGFVGISIWPTK